MRRRGRRRPLKKRPGRPADIAGRPSFFVQFSRVNSPKHCGQRLPALFAHGAQKKEPQCPQTSILVRYSDLPQRAQPCFSLSISCLPKLSMADKDAFYAPQKPLCYAISRYDLVRNLFSGVYGAFTGVIRGLLRLNFQKRAKSLCFSGVLWYNNSVKMNLCASI